MFCNQRVLVVRMFATEMRRFNFFIEQQWLDRAKRDMAKHGHRTVSGFLRYIIIRFFEKGNTEKLSYFDSDSSDMGSNPIAGSDAGIV